MITMFTAIEPGRGKHVTFANRTQLTCHLIENQMCSDNTRREFKVTFCWPAGVSKRRIVQGSGLRLYRNHLREHGIDIRFDATTEPVSATLTASAITNGGAFLLVIEMLALTETAPEAIALLAISHDELIKIEVTPDLIDEVNAAFKPTAPNSRSSAASPKITKPAAAHKTWLAAKTPEQNVAAPAIPNVQSEQENLMVPEEPIEPTAGVTTPEES